MSLTTAVDAALAYVQAHADRMTRAELDEFKALASEVYRLAMLAGLVDALPRIENLRPQLESDGTLPPAQYESKLNLPGDWHSEGCANDTLRRLRLHGEPEPIPEPVYLVCATSRWREDMDSLRALAEAMIPALKGNLAQEVAQQAPGTPPAPATTLPTDNLTPADVTILEALGTDTLQGKEIATKAGYQPDYVRRRLAALVKQGHLTRTAHGYRRSV